MARLYLGSVVLSGITIYALLQLIRGYRFGVISAWRFRRGGGHSNDFQVIIDVRREDKPLVFGYCVLIYSLLLAGAPWAMWHGVIKPYSLGEIAPTISFVQPSDVNNLHISWNPPNRLDEPVRYVVYRLDANNGNKTKIGSTKDNTQFVDQNVQQGTTYTYQIEAQFKGLTAWMIGDRSTTSDPVSGKTFSW